MCVCTYMMMASSTSGCGGRPLPPSAATSNGRLAARPLWWAAVCLWCGGPLCPIAAACLLAARRRRRRHLIVVAAKVGGKQASRANDERQQRASSSEPCFDTMTQTHTPFPRIFVCGWGGAVDRAWDACAVVPRARCLLSSSSCVLRSAADAAALRAAAGKAKQHASLALYLDAMAAGGGGRGWRIDRFGTPPRKGSRRSFWPICAASHGGLWRESGIDVDHAYYKACWLPGGFDRARRLLEPVTRHHICIEALLSTPPCLHEGPPPGYWPDSARMGNSPC